MCTRSCVKMTLFSSLECAQGTTSTTVVHVTHRNVSTSQRDHENEEEEEANRAKDNDRLLLNRHLLDGFLHRR